MEMSECILVVEDEKNIRHYIKRILEHEGYYVLAAEHGEEALEMLEAAQVDLILSDIAMPVMNGYQLYECVSRRSEWVVIPFIFLTARALDSDIRYGKELGVDDYVTKPFAPDDLLVVVRGRLRRARLRAGAAADLVPQSVAEQDADMLVRGKLRIDLNHHRVWWDSETVKLSSREFKLLGHLVRRENQVVPLQELVRTTHGLVTDSVEAGALLRPLIRSLRRKLGYPPGQMGCIENTRGVGYQFIPQGGRSDTYQ
jgi:DNA-binding response OmpR family regulator